jgi:hypothetical protein
MPSIRLTKFGGINTEIAARNSGKEVAQIAHNCLLWDGSLRPLAQWRNLNVVGYDCRSVHIDTDDVTIKLNSLEDAAFLTSEVFAKSTVVGLAADKFQSYQSNIGYTNDLNPANTAYEVSVPQPILSNASTVTYTPEYISKKAVNRLYAVSTLRYNGSGYEESPLTLIPNQSSQTVVYEGDLANIHIVLADARLHERSKMRLYRSISAMDTASGIVNELDTEWFLVTELGTIGNGLTGTYDYFDGGSATSLSMDVHLADRHNPPAPYTYTALTVAEGGWVAAATADGKIAVSERYQYHGWPSENYASIPETVTDLVAHYDTLYVGTKNRPYAVSLANGEALGLQMGVIPFTASYECLADTMDVTTNGAMYATNAGVISLSKQGMELVTSGVASGVRPLYCAQYADNTTVMQPPEQAVIVGSTLGGTLAAATHYYVVTAKNGAGETKVSNERSVVNTGSTSSNRISWEHVKDATFMRIYRGTAPGAENVYYEIANDSASTDVFLDTGATAINGTPPNTNTAIEPTEKCTELHFRDTDHGAYFNGKYFGFAQLPRDDGLRMDLGYLFDTGSTLDGEHPLQKLITFDGPPGKVISHTTSSSGLDVLIGIPNPDILVDADIKNSVHSMPFPNTKEGGTYDLAPKMCYRWKSKKFVFPGNMCMSAAKVVHDCNGHVRIKFYVDCCCRYEVLVKDCKPFRLPDSMQGVEWEVEVIGTATVHEIHVASSLRELIEHDRYADRGSGIIGTLGEQ